MSKSETRRVAVQKTGKLPDPPDWELTKANVLYATRQAIKAFEAFAAVARPIVQWLEENGELKNAEDEDDASDEEQERTMKDE